MLATIKRIIIIPTGFSFILADAMLAFWVDQTDMSNQLPVVTKFVFDNSTDGDSNNYSQQLCLVDFMADFLSRSAQRV